MPRPISRHTTRRETDAPPSADSNLAPDESPAAAAANQPSRDPLGDTHEEPFGPVQLGSAFDDENAEVDASEGASGMTISNPGEGERVKALVATTARKETYIADRTGKIKKKKVKSESIGPGKRMYAKRKKLISVMFITLCAEAG